MKEVYLKIETCTKCPNCKVDRDYTEDSYEYVERWDCGYGLPKEFKNIRRYVDWHDKQPFIPDWCPLKNKK